MSLSRPDHHAARSASDERARLWDLLSLNILDTQREERFDRYTRLVAQIFDVPTAHISFIDKRRQWFKASTDEDAVETPLEESICAYAIHHDSILEIPDARSDPFFRTHPAVSGHPYVRFYAGAVLRGPTGQPIGTLCIVDQRPRQLSQEQRKWLIEFSNMVEEDIRESGELTRARSRVQEVTLRDTETGLPTESLLVETIEDICRLASSQKRLLALMHLRLGNLDAIARAHGRDVKSRVLEHVAERLTRPDSQVLAAGRVAAARFTLVLPLAAALRVFETASPILRSLEEPFEIDGHKIRVEVEAGVSVYPDDGLDVETLHERARTALTDPHAYQGVHAFSREAEANAVRRHRIEQRLDLALSHNKLSLHFQPLFKANGTTLVGFEALARWTDTELGRVSPGEFIPIAEQNGRLSHALTRWVMSEACEQASSWPAEVLGHPMRVAVNIPAREFFRRDFVDVVLETLQTARLDPRRLTLELTEESLVTDIEEATRTMARLREHGIRVALDDFGTGYSSLSYLRRLPVDALKIDKSFVDDLPDVREASEVAIGVLRIAHGLGLHVVAEGVEHEGQRSFLEQLGFDCIQGYLLGRPGDAESAKKYFGSVRE